MERKSFAVIDIVISSNGRCNLSYCSSCPLSCPLRVKCEKILPGDYEVTSAFRKYLAESFLSSYCVSKSYIAKAIIEHRGDCFSCSNFDCRHCFITECKERNGFFPKETKLKFAREFLANKIKESL